MKMPIRTLAIALTGSLIAVGFAAPGMAAKAEVAQVQVLGRTWTVSQNRKKPNAYVASRDNTNLNPFGKPVARRTPQAVRALELATGCKVVPGTLWQTVGAEFHADMACNR